MIKLLNRLLAEDFEINLGRHFGYSGYFATIRKIHEDYEYYDYCDSPRILDDWDCAGHGHTPEDALLEAEAIAKGQQDQTKYKTSSFTVVEEEEVFNRDPNWQEQQ